ncbi:MAG: hypothetical protein KAV82_07070 [Phycisphaerae bacterium]|nr:hypothetical protein [Phycisphaerae bacterium]
MPTYVRWRESGASYFFTVVTYRRRPLFRDAHARAILRKALVDVRHRWANIKRLFTQGYLRDGGRALPVSGNRFKHNECGVWKAKS